MIPQSTLGSLQKTLNTCFTLTTNLTPTLKNYKQEKLFRLQELLTLENNKLGYQMDKDLLPKNISHLLWTDSKDKTLKKTHRYQTRGRHLPKMPRVTKSKYHHGFQLASIRSYDRLSPEIRDSPTLYSFLRKLKQQLLVE